MTTEEGLNGLIPQRFFGGGRRYVTDVIAINVMLALLRKSSSEAGDQNGNAVSFVMCANAIYSVCV